MEITLCNPKNGSLETIDFEFTKSTYDAQLNGTGLAHINKTINEDSTLR